MGTGERKAPDSGPAERRRGKVLRPFDPWRSPLCTCPPKYSLHPYTGCDHHCLYCYATAYIGLRPSTPKKGFLETLRKDLVDADPSIPVELSSSSDPYPPPEARLKLTRSAIRLLVVRGFRVLVTTKSHLVVRDLDILSKGNAAVMVTVTTMDESVARLLEPGAPAPGERIKAIKALALAGVPVGARIDPVIPGLNDDPGELEELVGVIADAGAKHVVTSTYKARPDSLSRLVDSFPELERTLRRLYLNEGERFKGYRYLLAKLRARLLEPVVQAAKRLGLSYATCREGLTGPEFFSAPSCDGSHLILGRECSQRAKKDESFRTSSL